MKKVLGVLLYTFILLLSSLTIAKTDIFANPNEIKEWIIANNSCDKRGTAICPKCNIDSVIGESSGFPITKEFLIAMNKRWF